MRWELIFHCADLVILCVDPFNDKVREKLDENTPFKHSQWKRVEIEEKGKKKYVTNIPRPDAA
jgi:hypothetical protein